MVTDTPFEGAAAFHANRIGTKRVEVKGPGLRVDTHAGHRRSVSGSLRQESRLGGEGLCRSLSGGKRRSMGFGLAALSPRVILPQANRDTSWEKGDTARPGCGLTFIQEGTECDLSLQQCSAL